ncbi:hypothetical protein TRFO_05070 [Tritrichomonas foetus]|uniref:HYDIN/VesB/CFA65-like Ig-like domain-containing protein n=1 Tax=Tritrichomonas foetus TaxID=1144522 RepID=A0A1J4K9N4_9EUKA|nr:hypothetical protein TRFO_05070 [Tritrichomonas foetus]|eukprot:OHT07947.1 hypothetical protein TRFO_05070 [Tritrichomonas foetus]
MTSEELVTVLPSTIYFPQTFITATVRFTATIRNNSDKTLHYRWCKYATEEEDNEALNEIDVYDPSQRAKIEQLLEFNSPNFFADPPRGEVWPHRSQIVVFEFTPDVAKPYDITAYLYDDILNKRHKVTLEGSGLPPDAQFDIDTINIGHVTLDSICEYKVNLINKGNVDINYDINPKSKYGLTFIFSPSKDLVRIGESKEITIKFIASNVGQFNEVFPFDVRGATNFSPSLTFYGKVVGPDLLISSKLLNFGDVSYGFLYTATFDIENKSEIPFDYILHFQQDTSFSPREFSILPANGTISKFSKETITVEFVPNCVRNYNLKLILDILKVGKAVETISIYANCVSPVLTLKGKTVDFGHIFIGKEYTSKLVLKDDTDFPAKYEFALPEATNASQALISVSKPRGVIKAKQHLEIKVNLVSQVLGPIKIEGFIRIFGGDNSMLPFTINALSTGPNITINPQLINFGSIPVLIDNSKKITITNDSLIPAVFETSIQSEYKVFRVEPNEGEIQPKSSIEVYAIANLDDTLNFSGKIHFNFKNLNPINVDLLAAGIGTPVKASIDMEKIDFGFILNEQQNPIVFTLTNHGRRQQDIRWSISKPKVDEKALSSYSFKVVPEQLSLSPHHRSEFKLIASCAVPCEFTQALICNATLGRQRVELFTPICTGKVIKPLLSFSKNTIEFTHVHDYKKEEAMIDQENQSVPSPSLLPSQTDTFIVTNLVQLPLNVTVDCHEPFSVSPASFSMEPNSTQELIVLMNASFKTDFISEVLNKKLVFSFENHPQKLYVNLRGNFVFPNLSFSPGKVLNFGNLLLNTEQTKEVKIKASSDSPVEWTWQLISEDTNNDLCRIFDVFPTRGVIQVGEEESIHFSFFAYGGEDGRSAKYNANAICHIAGGPDYVIQLSGAAAAINYKVEPTELNFGHHSYNETLTKSMTIHNLGDVSITYSIKIPKSCKFNQFSIYPMDGTIAVDNTATINLTIICGLPKEYQESFVVQIGHFDEIKVPVTIYSNFPQIRLNLPRCDDDPATVMNSDSCPLNPDVYSETEKKIMISRLSDRYIALTEAKPTRRRFGQTGEYFSGYSMAKYLLDLGEITIGEYKEFDFELQSLTTFPISIRSYDSKLSETGFSIEPSAVNSLPPKAKIPMKFIFDTAKRSIHQTGDVSYDINFEMNEDLGFTVVLKAALTLPTLKFSKQHFDFGEVIVGQSKTVTLQLQNMTNVQCEFNFGESMPLNAIYKAVVQQSTPSKRNSSLKNSKNNEKKEEEEVNEEEKTPRIFFATPVSGILRPATFLNVELSFVPINGESYSMQLPVTIKHNTQPLFVTVSGKGAQLRVEFDPPSLNVPAIQPFSEPSQVEVTLINPLNYPIEVFSYQFDFDLFVDHFKRKDLTTENNNITFAQQTSVSKFSICVIVTGARQSGCSTVAKIASAHLNNAPIIILSELWKDLLLNPESAAADYTAKFFERISQADCSDGFVVDGLEALKEPVETDQFLLSCLKQKNCIEDNLQRPMQPISHSVPTSMELALKYIIAGLDGHYILIVGVRTTIEIITERLEAAKNEEKKRKHQKTQEEISMLFNMSEQEYEQLDDAKKIEVDKKRKSLRRHMVKEAENEIKQQSEHNSKSRKHDKNHRKSRHDKGDDKTARNSKDDKNSNKAVSSTAVSEPPKPKEDNRRRKPAVPTDPYELSYLKFNLTFGSIVNSVKDSCDNFQSLNPTTLFAETPTFEKAIQQHNAILLEPEISTEEIDSTLTNFIPKLERLIEVSFTNLIPSERVEILNTGTQPTTKFDESPKYFSIVNTEPVGELPDFEVEEKPSNRGRSSSRRGARGGATARSRGKKGANKQADQQNDLQSTQPAHNTPQQIRALASFDTEKLTSRWRIEPNSRRSIFIRFDPTMIGTYKNDLLFGLSRCLCDILRLPVTGICAYPNIERSPKVIFSKRVNKCDARTEFAWANDISEFVFGSVLIAKDKPARGVQPLYQEKLHFQNISMFPVELHLSFKDTTGKVMWTTDPQVVQIPPNTTSDVMVGCHPSTTEVSKTTLVAIVKDHPDPLFLNFSVESCIPSAELSTLTFDFDRLLLNQSRTLNLEIKNTSKLGCAWRLKKTNELNCITFNEIEGVIPPNKNFIVKGTFTSPKPVQIRKAIIIEILDKDKLRVFNTQQINIIAEVFDVTIDFQYPKGMDHLQFGTLKVLQSRQIPCVFKNKGKFPIDFKVIYDTNNIANLISVQPTDGTMNPNDKPLTITFTFKGTKVLTYGSSKGITLSVTDPITKTTTCKLPIPFSAETVYSHFSINPSKKINFGPVSVNTSAYKQLTITNTGKFPFDFDVTGKIDDPSPPTSTSAFAAKKKAAPPPKQQRGKKGGTHVQIGNYTITPSSGALQPNASQTIDLEFMSPNPGDFKANIYFKVSDYDPNAHESYVSLVTNSVVPGILTNDFEKIFPGTHLCLRYDLQRANKTSFLEDEIVLHFEPLVLQQKANVTVAMVNPFPVPCSVDIAVKPKTKVSNANFPFDVSEKVVNLEPNSTKNILLYFNPTINENITANFEATVRGGAGDSKIMKFGIEGTGTLPIVNVDGCMEKGKGNSYVCNLGRTLIGFTKEKVIRIMNDGLIGATVNLAIKPNPDFQYPSPDQLKDIYIPARTAHSFSVIFKPDKPRNAQIDMSLTVVDNSKAGFPMSIVAEGSSEDVIFEGLSNDDNDLNFKDCIVGRQQQNVFTMRNVGLNDVRFVWNSQGDIVFSPRVGHIHMNKTKSIVVTTFSDHPIKQATTKVSCSIQKIKFTERETSDWDDSMKLVKFVPRKTLLHEQQQKEQTTQEKEPVRTPVNSKKKGGRGATSSSINQEKEKELQQQQQQIQIDDSNGDELVRVTEVKPEPAYTIIPGKGKELPMKVTVVADVIKYSIDTTEIAFSPTMMYQSRTSEVKLTNCCQIRFEYNWHVTKFVSLRTNYSMSRPAPFFVMPSSGFVEPGQTKIIKVCFHPEEVDDFTAQLRCDIPFLTQMEPPIIDVSGLSRRPLCHFNVEQSDYLTRRHPDYTNKLPEGIHVIEMFSKGINQKTIKKFELINPTSAPYEMEWIYVGEGKSPIYCETPNGLISSGKRSSVSFAYNPVSLKTIESQWEFQIPEHNVRVSFLFVGRIMP